MFDILPREFVKRLERFFPYLRGYFVFRALPKDQNLCLRPSDVLLRLSCIGLAQALNHFGLGYSAYYAPLVHVVIKLTQSG